MTSGLKRFKKFIQKNRLSLEIISLPNSTKTAVEAAQAIGCRVGQIAKSIVFKTESGKPVLVIASGANRIDENKLTKILGEKVEKADADFIKENTGFVIGGVPPFAHLRPIKTFLDADLFKFSEIWAAAGDSFSVFKTTAEQLKQITNAQVEKIS